MIADWAIDAPQDHRRVIGAQGVIKPIFTFGRPGTSLNLPRQPDRSLGFANIR